MTKGRAFDLTRVGITYIKISGKNRCWRWPGEGWESQMCMIEGLLSLCLRRAPLRLEITKPT